MKELTKTGHNMNNVKATDTAAVNVNVKTPIVWLIPSIEKIEMVNMNHTVLTTVKLAAILLSDAKGEILDVLN
jgi:hypothetical protein